MENTSQIRILYIDDEPILCDLFQMTMQPYGHTIDVALNGEDGLALYTKFPYDVVALDYQLGDMTGIDVARHLLDDDPELPIVLVTGKGNERLVVEALNLGISNYVIKDSSCIYMEIIPKIIEQLVGRSRLQKEKVKTEQDLKFSEQRFRDFAEIASDFYWEFDQDLKFTYLSDSHTRITGIPKNEFIGKKRENTMPPGVEPDVWKRHVAELKSHAPIKDFINSRQHPNGRTVWVSTSGQPVFNSNGVFKGYRGVGREVTDQIESETENARFAAAIDSLDILVSLYDSENRLVMANKMAFELNTREAVSLSLA